MIYISMIFGTRLRREWFSHEAIVLGTFSRREWPGGGHAGMTFSSSIAWLAYSSAAVTSWAASWDRCPQSGIGIAASHHAENILHHNVGTSNRGLPAADFGIDNDTIIPNEFLSN